MRNSQHYADRAAEQESIIDYLTDPDTNGPNDNATRLGIDAEELSSLTSLKTSYDEAYATYLNPATRTSITIAAMKEADENSFAVILPMRQRLKNGKAPLTPDDYARLGIHQDKTTRTPAEIPKEVPIAVLVKSTPQHLTFEATEQTPEGANRRALPKGCRVARQVAVVAQGTEPTEADFHSFDSIGRSRFVFSFASAEIGMNAYVRLAYETTAGRGEWSPPVKAIII